MQLTIAATGPQPVGVVWERYARLSLWPTWSPYILRASPSAAVLAPGLAGRVHGPLGVTVRYSVSAVDAAARQWSWTVRLGPVRVSLRHGISPAGSGSVAWLVLRGPAAVVVAYAPLAGWSLHRLVTMAPAG